MQAKINQLTNKGDKYNDYMIDRIADISFSKGYFVIKRKDGRMLSLDAKLHSIAGVWPDDDDSESDGLSEVLLRGTPEDDAACRDLKAFFNLCILKGMGFEAIKGVPGEQAALNKKDNSCGTVVQNDFYYASEDPSIWANIDDERKRYLRKIQDSKKRFFTIDGGKLYEITMGGCIIDKSSFGEDKTVSPNQFGHCFACDSVREAYAAFDYRQSDEDKADASALTNELSESEFPFETKNGTMPSSSKAENGKPSRNPSKSAAWPCEAFPSAGLPATRSSSRSRKTAKRILLGNTFHSNPIRSGSSPWAITAISAKPASTAKSSIAPIEFRGFKSAPELGAFLFAGPVLASIPFLPL
jgi:hypothetical protein